MFGSTRRHVIDGAMATELERRGADLNDRLWSARILLQSPQLIEDVHYDYFVAGADIALSASYQATFAGFSARGLADEEARRLLLKSVTLACTARERFGEQHRDGTRPAALVGASIGPYGAHRHDGSEYRGDYGVGTQQIRDFHRRQLEVLALSRADFIAFETVPCLAEGEAIVRLLEEFPELRAWISFSCRDELHVCHGERFADCAALANEHPGIIATGINCSAPEFVESLLVQARGVTAKALFAYPNSGETWRAADNCWLEHGAHASLAGLARRWLDAGATLIGGCCRTTPQDIRELAQAMRNP